jgi:hypothetical protein
MNDESRGGTYTDGVGHAETEADEGVGERHDRGDDGEPGHVVEVRYEGEEELRAAEDEHVVAAVVVAGRVVAVAVVAVGLQNRAATSKQQSSPAQQADAVKNLRSSIKSAEKLNRQF